MTTAQLLMPRRRHVLARLNRSGMLLVFAAVSACMTNAPAEGEVSGQLAALGDDEQDDAPITWAACPTDFASECAWVPLPIDHKNPRSKALPIFVSRRPASSRHATGQLWLLQGGPGGSGNIFGSLTETLSELLPTFDLYVLEHRGVGESARLGCDSYENPLSDDGFEIADDEWPACTEEVKDQWGESLAYFSTTQDAYDLGALIKRTRAPGQQAFVYGVSYGTTRAMRFLQLYPDLVDGVILDSVVSPGVQYLSQFDEQFDMVAQDLSALCAQDPVCGEKLGSDPWSKILALLEKLQAGHCPAFLHRSLVQGGFAQMLMIRDLRAHIFPIAYRLDRCAPEDVAVIENYLAVVSELLSGPTDVDRESLVLQTHVTLSELWETPEPSLDTLNERCDSVVLCPGVGPDIGQVAPYWPRYEQDELVGKWPETDTPILAMNGTLDPQTTLETAIAAKDHFTAEHQHFITVPWSPHGVIFETPVATHNQPPCGLQLLLSFVQAPKETPDTNCLTDLRPPFDTNPRLNAALFPNAYLWENPTLQPATPPKTLNPQAFQVRPLTVQPLNLHRETGPHGD